ncbi:MAG: hypothetical protein DRG37_06450 [Deltaproteobacteria bacterium]|nr:MAG: hypothetical protein DRG37_06450 [Deltaproteobacteria bacterium]
MEMVTLGIVIAVLFVILAGLVGSTTVSGNTQARTAINNITAAITASVVNNFQLILDILVYTFILSLVAMIAIVGYNMFKGRGGVGIM